MNKLLMSRAYWHQVMKSAVLPLLKEYVEETENQLDDSVYLAVEKLCDALLGPK